MLDRSGILQHWQQFSQTPDYHAMINLAYFRRLVRYPVRKNLLIIYEIGTYGIDVPGGKALNLRLLGPYANQWTK